MRIPSEFPLPVILLADDDPDDRLLVQHALRTAFPDAELRQVEDGEALMDYLLRRGAFAAPGAAPRPVLILLDLNMPRKTGHEALREIKAHRHLRSIPVLIFSTSTENRDVVDSYDGGANAYLTKPERFDELVSMLQRMSRFWFGVVRLPAEMP